MGSIIRRSQNSSARPQRPFRYCAHVGWRIYAVTHTSARSQPSLDTSGRKRPVGETARGRVYDGGGDREDRVYDGTTVISSPTSRPYRVLSSILKCGVRPCTSPS